MTLKKSSLLSVMLLSFFLLPAGAIAEGAKKEVHIVVKGDTLWDISETYLHNPFLWPKLWQWNDYIMNPHFIYPGDKIRLLPPKRVVRKIVKVQEAAAETEEAVEPVQFEEIEQEEAVTEEKAKPEPVIEGKKYNIRHLRSSGMISAEELARSGSILDAKADRTMLSVGDVIYVTLKEEAAPGDIFSVFKPKQEIRHPITGVLVGNKIERLGRMKVTSYADNLATATIIESFNVISRGDLVKPWIKLPEEITISESALDLKGYIISAKEELSLYGENDVVYIDLGKSAGVETGNLFVSYREEYLKDGYTVPPVTIGRLLVFEVKENTSSAVIIDSVEEMRAGEKIKTVMR